MEEKKPSTKLFPSPAPTGQATARSILAQQPPSADCYAVSRRRFHRSLAGACFFSEAQHPFGEIAYTATVYVINPFELSECILHEEDDHYKTISRMDNREGNSDDNWDIQIRQIFAEFLTGVTNLEQLAAAGGKFLRNFQHGLELLRRPPMNETSELVQSIIKANESKRVRSYTEAGWAKMHDKMRHICEMNKCFEGLRDHLSKAQQVMCELELLMDNSRIALEESRKSSSDVSDYKEENESTSSTGIDATEYASFMAVIYGMVRQDYVMQERIVSSLNLMTSSEELESYCLMWSLRPFVDDDIISQALRYIP